MASARVIVVGAGGHARVCLEALGDDMSHQIVGCVSRDGTGLADLGVDVLGADGDLESLAAAHGATNFFVAVGDNETRAALTGRCLRAGLVAVNVVSRYARLSHTATLGSGVALLPGALVNAAARLGDGVIVNTNASVDHDCVVGAFAHLAPAVAIAGGVSIGERALLGIGARVIPGVTIGADAVVGAGAVVVSEVPAGITVVGSPARPIRRSARRD